MTMESSENVGIIEGSSNCFTGGMEIDQIWQGGGKGHRMTTSDGRGTQKGAPFNFADRCSMKIGRSQFAKHEIPGAK
jgi:hypothetical protein